MSYDLNALIRKDSTREDHARCFIALVAPVDVVVVSLLLLSFFIP